MYTRAPMSTPIPFFSRPVAIPQLHRPGMRGLGLAANDGLCDAVNTAAAEGVLAYSGEAPSELHATSVVIQSATMPTGFSRMTSRGTGYYVVPRAEARTRGTAIIWDPWSSIALTPTDGHPVNIRGQIPALPAGCAPSAYLLELFPALASQYGPGGAATNWLMYGAIGVGVLAAGGLIYWLVRK